MDKKISVVIPAYNERTRLPPTLAEIEVFCFENDIVNEVIVVDDASKDQTVERAMYYHSRIPGFKIVRHDENKGKWGAIQTGIETASNDAVLLLDADGSASINELNNMDEKRLQWVLHKKVPVFGTRFHADSVVEGKSPLRTIVSYGYRFYVRFWYWMASGKRDIDDMQCPFKLVHKSDIDRIQTAQYAGDIELALMFSKNVYNYPVRFIHQDGGHIGFSTMVEMFIQTAKVAMKNGKEHKGEGSQVHTDVHNDVQENNNVY